MISAYYTIQTIEAWNEAQRLGYLEGKKEYILDECTFSYVWIVNQMKKKLSLYNGEFPVWLWVEKPDLRRSGFLSSNESGVLLEIHIPDERVLLSDFELWHCVLCNDYVIENEEEIELIKAGKFFLTKEESWERIFNVTKFSKNAIQGTTGRVYMDEIKFIRIFKGKGNVGRKFR